MKRKFVDNAMRKNIYYELIKGRYTVTKAWQDLKIKNHRDAFLKGISA